MDWNARKPATTIETIDLIREGAKITIDDRSAADCIEALRKRIRDLEDENEALRNQLKWGK